MYGTWGTLFDKRDLILDDNLDFKRFVAEAGIDLRRKGDFYKNYIRGLFSPDSFECMLLHILRCRRLGFKFDVCVPLQNILGAEYVDEFVGKHYSYVATFYCPKLGLVIEPLRDDEDVSWRDALYLFQGIHVLRVRESRDLDSVRGYLMSVFLNYESWKQYREVELRKLFSITG